MTQLSCPSGRKVKKGDRFQCQGQAANGVPITVAVVQTSGGGSVGTGGSGVEAIEVTERDE